MTSAELFQIRTALATALALADRLLEEELGTAPKPVQSIAPPKRKRHQPLRSRKGSGGAQKVGDGWRGRRQRKGEAPLLGPVRKTREEAIADLYDLNWPDEVASLTLRRFAR